MKNPPDIQKSLRKEIHCVSMIEKRKKTLKSIDRRSALAERHPYSIKIINFVFETVCHKLTTHKE